MDKIFVFVCLSVICCVSATTISRRSYKGLCKDPNEEFVSAKLNDPTCDGLMPRPCQPVNGCRCKPGFVRHENICIKPSQCPKKCNPNEEYALTERTEPTCESSLTEPADKVLKCTCIKGYVRHNGDCIHPDDCPRIPGPDEMVTRGNKYRGPICKNSNEEYAYSNMSEPTCDESIPKPSTPRYKCRCKNDLVRHNKVCIPLQDCPVICKDENEQYVTVSTTEPTCDERIVSAIPPVTECRCKPGFVRHNTVCIPEKSCPVTCADPNEEHKLHSRRERTCDGLKPVPIPPVEKCQCKDDYVRHEGVCISPEKCPVICKDPNEVYVTVNTTEPTCDERNGTPIPPVTECRCKPGFVRHNTVCIPEKSCPPKCGRNEVYNYTEFTDPSCDAGAQKLERGEYACRCKKGYVRQDGECIVPWICSGYPDDLDKPSTASPSRICKGPNEAYVYSNMSEPTCAEPEPKPSLPNWQCRCKRGFVRHNSICIPLEDCPIKCSDPNEEYRLVTMSEPTCEEPKPVRITPIKRCQCKDGYVRHNGVCIFPEKCPRKCNDINEKYVLADTTEPTCDSPSKKSIKPVKECRCAKGYIRHKNGTCIDDSKCPVTCADPNEEYKLHTRRERTCDEQKPVPIPPVEKCQCKDDYVRHEGVCISPDKCPVICKDPNEVYVTVNTTEPTCDERNVTAIPTVTECRCKPGFVRHNTVCIPEKSCPVKCNDPNEDYTIALFSEPTCDDPLPRTITPIKECRCRNGYVRHESKCIKPEECPKKCDSTDEEYVEVSMSEPTCDQRVPISVPTVKECRCKAGLVRYQGKCISPENCPVTCPDPNESYVLTFFTEPTCDDPIPRSAPPAKECRCNQGYVRHEKQCIKREECPVKCKSINEKYITANTTEITCDDRIPKPIPEVKECRCINGYARYNGECIPIAACPVVCKENEDYIYALFTEPTCDDQIPKTLPVAVSECRCRAGYVRHNGKCILREECPPKCKDPNEEYVHAIFSEPTCDNQIPRSITPLMECRCKQGYVRHNGICIPRDSCPVKCLKPNEEYTITSYEEPTCNNPIPKPCAEFRGCRCKSGFLRNDFNQCVNPYECPCHAYEIFSMTRPKEQESCYNLGKPRDLTPDPGCMCVSGYVRNCNNQCIRSCDCPFVHNE